MADYTLAVHTGPNFQVVDILLLDGGLIEPHAILSKPAPPIDSKRGVILSGRGPVWLYARLVSAYTDAAWTAVFNPRNGAVIIASRVADHKIGDVIPLEAVLPLLPRHEHAPRQNARASGSSRAVALVGPPHSGKSVLLYAVWGELQATPPASFVQREVFVLRACPDGEGAWTSEESQVQNLRYKNRWDDDFARQVCEHIECLRRSKELLLVDCGGIIDRYNQAIWNQCTHALIVSHDAAAFPEWRGAVRASGLEVLAEVETSLSKIMEVVPGSPLRLRLGPTCRGQAGPGVPRQLIDALLGRSSAGTGVL